MAEWKWGGRGCNLVTGAEWKSDQRKFKEHRGRVKIRGDRGGNVVTGAEADWGVSRGPQLYWTADRRASASPDMLVMMAKMMRNWWWWFIGGGDDDDDELGVKYPIWASPSQAGSLTHLAVHGDKTFPGSLNARFLIPSNPTGWLSGGCVGVWMIHAPPAGKIWPDLSHKYSRPASRPAPEDITQPVESPLAATNAPLRLETGRENELPFLCLL